MIRLPSRLRPARLAFWVSALFSALVSADGVFFSPPPMVFPGGFFPPGGGAPARLLAVPGVGLNWPRCVGLSICPCVQPVCGRLSRAGSPPKAGNRSGFVAGLLVVSSWAIVELAICPPSQITGAFVRFAAHPRCASSYIGAEGDGKTKRRAPHGGGAPRGRVGRVESATRIAGRKGGGRFCGRTRAAKGAHHEQGEETGWRGRRDRPGRREGEKRRRPRSWVFVVQRIGQGSGRKPAFGCFKARFRLSGPRPQGRKFPRLRLDARSCGNPGAGRARRKHARPGPPGSGSPSPPCALAQPFGPFFSIAPRAPGASVAPFPSILSFLLFLRRRSVRRIGFAPGNRPPHTRRAQNTI